MKILFANIPFVKIANNRIYTGPSAGSRWPWTMEGASFHGYAPYPFYLAYAAQYCQYHGYDVALYDGVADCHSNLDLSFETIVLTQPSIVFFDVATPTYNIIDQIAERVKHELGCTIVYCGPHMYTYAAACIKSPHVDYCIIGEYDKPALKICNHNDPLKTVYDYDLLDNIDVLAGGDNFVPYRDYNNLGRYYDPSMQTARTQVQVMTSRGCPFKCTYCQWPKVVNNGKYRARSAQNVVQELESIAAKLGNSLGSFFFDDDTFNLGPTRITEICNGLKHIGKPWTMMGRIDTATPALYDIMVNSGCVGMRFGVESFNQQLLDNSKKHLSAKQSYDNLVYIVSHYSNMEFHFTTMKNLPGSKPNDWEHDRKLLASLVELGQRHGNRVHYQNSDCIPFPGTELWEELVQLGFRSKLEDFRMYDGHPDRNSELAATIGKLGTDYAPKYSKYSKMGEPVLPE